MYTITTLSSKLIWRKKSHDCRPTLLDSISSLDWQALDQLLSLAFSVSRHLEELPLGHDVLVGQLTAGRDHHLFCRFTRLCSEFLKTIIKPIFNNKDKDFLKKRRTPFKALSKVWITLSNHLPKLSTLSSSELFQLRNLSLKKKYS